MSKIGNIIYGIVSVAAIGFAGKACRNDLQLQKRYENIDARIETYMENRPQYELENIKRAYLTCSERQVALDSLAYREIFMGTHAAKDSVLLNEFNKVAASMNTLKMETVRQAYLYSNLSKIVTHKQYKKIQNETKNDLLTLQFKADSVVYRRFFEKHGLMNDSLAKKLTGIAKKIKP